MSEKFILLVFLFVTDFLVSGYGLPMQKNETVKVSVKEADDQEVEKDGKQKPNIIDDLQSILEDTSKILRNIIEIKTRVLGPILEGVGKTIESVDNSEAIERTAEVVETVGSAGIKASTGFASAVNKAGTTSAPTILKVADTATDIGGRLVRLGICGMVCPIQSGEEREKCFDKHCGKPKEKDVQEQSQKISKDVVKDKV